MTDSAVTDFPEPDSPTNATIWPLSISRVMLVTAFTSPSPFPKLTERSLMDNIFAMTRYGRSF